MFPGTATAKLLGRLRRRRHPYGLALVQLDVNPEPDPQVFDQAFAVVSGTNNVMLVRVVPEPPAFVLTSLGLLVGIIYRVAGGWPGQSLRAPVREPRLTLRAADPVRRNAFW